MASAIVCRECGHHNPEGSTFCEECSAYLEWEGERLQPSRPRRPKVTPTGTEWADRTSSPQPVAGGPAPAEAPLEAEGLTDVFDPSLGPTPVAEGSPPGEREEPSRPSARAAGAMKPDEARARPVGVSEPDRVEVRLPGGIRCASCGTSNPPGQRFCRHCGQALAPSRLSSAVAGASAPVAPRPWWRRLADRLAGRDARRYSRDLVPRHRLLRVVAGAGAVGLVAAMLGLFGADPFGWVRQEWSELRPDRFVVVDRLTASTDPAEAERADFEARLAVDKSPRDGWATTWLGPSSVPDDRSRSCDPDGERAAGASLDVRLPRPRPLIRLAVAGGLPADDRDRLSLWRPTALQVHFSDGSCQRFTLRDEPGLQRFDLEVAEVDSLRIAVVAAVEPEVGERPLVAISQVKLWAHR